MFHSNPKPNQKQDSYEAPRDPGRAGGGGGGAGAGRGAGAGSVIGEGTRIEGSIHVSGTLRVDGEINGGAVVTTENLSVGAKGSIKADLTVKQAVISGAVVGKIRARERVELLAGAHVRGDVYAQSFKIEDGVFFHGTCVMGEAAASEVESASPAMRVIEGGSKGAGSGSGAGAQRAAGSGTPGSGTSGSGTPGSGTSGSGTSGSGTPGSGTPGSGTPSSGTPSATPATPASTPGSSATQSEKRAA